MRPSSISILSEIQKSLKSASLGILVTENISLNPFSRQGTPSVGHVLHTATIPFTLAVEMKIECPLPIGSRALNESQM